MSKINVKKYLHEKPQEFIATILEEAFWVSTLSPLTPYTRFEDDSMKGSLTITFSKDGDGWIEVLTKPDPSDRHHSFRFRTHFGGGQSLRVRNALLILAEAIRLDNEEFPQDREC